MGLDKEKKSTSDLIIRLFPSLSTSSKDTAVLEKEAKKLVESLTEEGGSQEKLESQGRLSQSQSQSQCLTFWPSDLTGRSLQVSPGTDRDHADQSPGFSGGGRVGLETETRHRQQVKWGSSVKHRQAGPIMVTFQGAYHVETRKVQISRETFFFRRPWGRQLTVSLIMFYS